MLIVKKYFYPLVGLAIIVNATALFSEIMEPDGALYAYISKQMALHNDWINLYNNGADWLDKPHFPFWITAFSFKLFGISAFSYKLPAFIFWLIGIRFTYLLAKSLYNTDIAQLTVLIYITALHGAIALFDVRAEHYLTALTIGTIYYLYKAYNINKFKYVFAASISAACAIMTKGIFILITIGGGFVIFWIITKQWKQFINYKWWLFLLLSFLFIVPELYTLYVQFDMHPEKVVFGQTHVSGIRFFFWDSQFGRFLNNGPIQGKGDPFLFIHTTLWAFLPWSIIFYVAIVHLFIKRKIVYNTAQWIIVGSAIITFLIFSLSKFQLPHYIIILFPQFAMITANYLVNQAENKKTHTYFSIIQTIFLLLAVIVIIALTIIYGIPSLVYIITAVIVVAAIIYFLCYKKNKMFLIVAISIGFALLLQLYLNLVFYPNLLQYQAGMMAGKWMNKNIGTDTIGTYNASSFTLNFYATAIEKKLNNLNEVCNFAKNKEKYIYTNAQYLDSFSSIGIQYNIVQNFDNFSVSRLNRKFINQKTRNREISKIVLLHLTSGCNKF